MKASFPFLEKARGRSDDYSFGRDIFCDHGTGARCRALPYRKRRNENGITADKRTRTDRGGVFMLAVIIGNDRSRTDISVIADAYIA